MFGKFGLHICGLVQELPSSMLMNPSIKLTVGLIDVVGKAVRAMKEVNSTALKGGIGFFSRRNKLLTVVRL